MRRLKQIVLVVAAAACLVVGAGCSSRPGMQTLAKATLEATTTQGGAASKDTTQGYEPESSSSTSAATSPPETRTAVAEKRVRIGINGDVPGKALPELVARQVVAAGGTPVRMQLGNLDVRTVDGIVLVGGADIRPKRYGEPTDPTTSVISAEREKYDLALTKAALDAGVPVLGICLGAQEIWVARGGSLVQDIPTEMGTTVNHRARERGQKVSLVANSTLAEAYGTQRLRVYSNHHQAADGAKVPQGLRVSATSSDGVVEGFESTTPRASQ